MTLKQMRVQNFRNISEAEFEPDPLLTVICGENGQGKTNLLESVWLLTGSKSFRGSKDLELVQNGGGIATVEGLAEIDGLEKTIRVQAFGPDQQKKGRFATVNEVDYKRASSLAGLFTAVVFEPGHLSLIKGGPDGRRRFLDAALCQLYPGFYGIIRRFSRALKQKNSLLKQIKERNSVEDLLNVFDEELASTGEEISRRRKEYILSAGPVAEQYYDDLSRGKEKLMIQYTPAAEPDGLLELFHKKRITDIRAGFCTAGPHREDFETFIDKKSARIYGSQGQQRSAVLSLKLAEAQHAKRVTGIHPCMLLDDVLSELDDSRQSYLLGEMQGKQTFVTTCNQQYFAHTNGKIIQVKNGIIIQ